MKRCTATAKTGRRCRAFALTNGVCRMHGRTPEERREQARAAGIRSGEVRRERGKTLSQRLSERLDRLADDRVAEILAAIEGGEPRVVGALIAALRGEATSTPSGLASPWEERRQRSRRSARSWLGDVADDESRGDQAPHPRADGLGTPSTPTDPNERTRDHRAPPGVDRYEWPQFRPFGPDTYEKP